MLVKNKPLVAVVSTSGVFPQAVGSSTFWDNICQKRDATTEVPSERWAAPLEWVHHPTPVADKAYSKRGCLVQSFKFDPLGYDLPPELLAQIDPLNQWALHAARSALNDCHTETLEKSRIGVILAAIALPTDVTSSLSRRVMSHRLIGRKTIDSNTVLFSKGEALSARVVSMPASITARALGLKGGSYTLDAACASSLYAVKLSCDALQSYRADAMMAGGVSRPDSLYTQIGFSQLRALSATGRCAPFDHSANGLVVGEGAGIVILKRLDDALVQGDTVLGVIRGIGLSNDMRGNLLAPESAGQLRAMQAAYQQAGWSPQDVDYIECHGAGTPVGDATELASLRGLWGDKGWKEGQCAIGSVKSVVGHLLTAAGAAGMIKTLMALSNKTLPPSLKFESPSPKSPLIGGPFRVQTDTEKWHTRDAATPRRAAVSAFGFGGINAHLLIEQYKPDSASIPNDGHSITIQDARKSRESVAIVGLELNLGKLSCLRSFQESVFNGMDTLTHLPPKRWKTPELSEYFLGGDTVRGGFIDEVAVSIGEFQIPPDEISQILPQQLLMLKVAAAALTSAGMEKRAPRERMGAVIGIGFDHEACNFDLRWGLPETAARWQKEQGHLPGSDALEPWLTTAKEQCGPPLTAPRVLGALGGIVASRIAREFRLGGPSFVVSAEEASGMRALEIGTRMLQSRELDAVIVGAVDLFCDERNLAGLASTTPFSANGSIRPFDQKADGTLPGEGAVALVLKRLEDAQADNDRIFAVVDGIGAACDGGIDTQAPSESAYKTSMINALNEANVEPSAISLVETHGSGIPSQDEVEAKALHAIFATSDKKLDKGIAIGTLKPLVGLSGAASGLASLAKAALCLHHRIVTPVVNYSKPASSLWQNGPFYMPHQPAYWVRNRSQGPRNACVSAITSDGNCMHVVMKEAPDQASAKVEFNPPNPMGPLPYGLFYLAGVSPEDLTQQLVRLDQMVQNRSYIDISDLMHQWFKKPTKTNHSKYHLSILADSLDNLRTHIKEAHKAVADEIRLSFGRNGGVSYLPRLEIQNNKIAFVYPGSGNHYVGMGRTLGAYWPDVLSAMDNATQQLKSQMLPQWYDPWRSDWPKQWRKQAYQALIANPLRPIFGQVLFGSHMTALLNKFGIEPDGVIGYSLGESAGLFAVGAWSDRGKMLDRLASSELFRTQLTGPCTALKQSWQLADDQTVDWQVAVINRSIERVDDILAHLPHVRRLIVNTPNQCVIGGLGPQVKIAIEKLACEAVYLDGVVTVHCDAAQPAAEAYRSLHLFDTTPVKDIQFYSCAYEKAYDLTSKAAADSIVQQALTGFNFPRTIEQAYADGVRIFLEVGPHTSCTGMIGQILKDEPHIAVAANQRNENECLALLKCLGTLAATGIPIKLDALVEGLSKDDNSAIESEDTTIRVKLGNGPLEVTQLPDPPRDATPSKIPNTKASPSVNPVQASTSSTHQADRSLLNISEILKELNDNAAATAKAHDEYLDLTQELTQQFGRTLTLHNQLVSALGESDVEIPHTKTGDRLSGVKIPVSDQSLTAVPAFDRQACMEFAIGSVGKMLGPRFDIIDTYPARVRLPDEPLMLVDRILSVKGDMLSLSSGQVVTEHDVLPDAWYLDGNRAPVCISVEAGQADLFLCAYLGIDHQVKGQRTYRLLDAKIKFHRGLPQPGETIRYDIRIDKFVRQEETYLFFFRFEGYINGEHLITMTNGCAGFFTGDEVRNSGGIILGDDDLSIDTRINGTPFSPLVPIENCAFTDTQIDALRQGDVAACFGKFFSGIQLPPNLCLPGGRMALINRILSLEPDGGRFGLGYIKAEADIHPQDWFLTCHFVDDMVMPGTLMYECCAHTLRVFLLRMGWISDKVDVSYEPLVGVDCSLKCRGPVTPETRKVHYVLEIKEVGYHPTPYVIADAHMYADEHYIVFFKNMSMQMSGIAGKEIETFWQDRENEPSTISISIPQAQATNSTPPLFSRENILAFAVGNPSQAFGKPYEIFDNERTIARLPGPPYCFIDRVTAIEPEQWNLAPGGWVEAQYDLHEDAWYFGADRSGVMPFCVLLEIALQPCGWLAAYAGSALRSKNDLKFRNLGGHARLHQHLFPVTQTLTMRTRMTKVSEAAEMIIENFDYEVWSGKKRVYSGTTYFGFFTEQTLAKQVGLREEVYRPGTSELIEKTKLPFDIVAPILPQNVAGKADCKLEGLQLPAKALLMIDGIEIASLHGGPHGLGFYRGYKMVDPQEWFFKAHFYQDPVCPGSLGVESFLQLVKYAAINRWPELIHSHRFEMVCDQDHHWSYRGQVIPDNSEVKIDAVITHVQGGDSPVLVADGFLQVDGIYIYKMEGFGVRLVPI